MGDQQVRYLIATLVLYVFAMFSKETAITMFPVFGMLAYWRYQETIRGAVKKGIWFILPVILIFVVRWILFGGQDAPAISEMDNPIVAAKDVIERCATSMVILLQ